MDPVALESCTVDLDRREAVRDGQRVRLTEKEARLLQYLAARPGEVVPRGELLQSVFGYSELSQSRTLDATIKTLRHKLERDRKAPTHLQTVYGEGYRFVPSAARSDIGPPAGPLIGRDREVAQIVDALRQPGWVAVSGAPGVGKTEVARAAARALLAAGVVHEAWAGLTLESGEIAAAVADHPGALWVLDDLAPAAEANVAAWVARVPGARWITTSRVRGTAPVFVEMGPLAPDAAVAMLEARTGRSHAAWPAVVDAVDRLPLGIELAATGLRVLSPAQLLEAWATAVPDPLDRALETCWNALSAGARTAAGACSGFAGAFTLADVLALTPPDVDAVNALQQLRAASLILRVGDDPPRFSWLRTVRQYVQGRLDNPEAAWLAAADVVLNRPAPLGDLPGRLRLRRHDEADLWAIVHRHSNPASVAMALVELREPVSVGGPYEPWLIRAQAVLTSPGLDREIRARLLTTVGTLRGGLGQLEVATAALAEALRISGSAGLRASAHEALGVQAMRAGQLAEATEHFEAALADGGSVALLEIRLGQVAQERGDPAQARDRFLRGRAAAQAASHADLAAFAGLGLSQLLLESGQLEEAESLLEEAVAAFAAVGRHNTQVAALLGLGVLALRRQEPIAARAVMTEAEAVVNVVGEPRMVGYVFAFRALAEAEAGQATEADRYAARGEVALAQAGDPTGTAFSAAVRARIAAARGDTETANAALVEAGPAAERSADVRLAIALTRAALPG